MKEKLYICRGCSIVSATKIGGCPHCGKMEGKEYTTIGLDGNEKTRNKPWYKTLEIEGRVRP